MKITKERKNAIISYILEKIAEEKAGLSRAVSEAFDISQSAVHLYLRSLQEQGVIERQGRDSYTLVTEKKLFHFSRSAGEIKSEGDVLAQSLAPFLTDLPENARRIWHYAASEMVNNVIDHSDAENLLILVEKNRIRLTVTILDDGVGAFRKIMEHFGYSSIEDAVIELSKGKLTTDSVHHSGEGVFFTSRIMDEFLLYSDHKAFSFNQYMEEKLANIKTEYPFSTCVYLSLANETKKEIADVFDEFADVNSGFIRTCIPMKNVFSSAPISRSQAKRICSRLDQFKEVELDFDGIDFMGQGFAHEIFFVFANAQQNVRLIALNASPALEKMIAHVSRAQEE